MFDVGRSSLKKTSLIAIESAGSNLQVDASCRAGIAQRAKTEGWAKRTFLDKKNCPFPMNGQ